MSNSSSVLLMSSLLPLFVMKSDESDKSSISSNTTIKSLQTTKAATHIRKILSNIILALFRYHPHGIFESNLTTIYYNMFGAAISLTTDLKYLLSSHKCITMTQTKTRGLLYTCTLKSEYTLNTIKSMDALLLQTYLIEHILRVFYYFPNGISVDCFDGTFQRITQFKLSDIIPSWFTFVSSIPYIICFKVNGTDVLMNTYTSHIIHQFDSNKILFTCAGYEQLLTSFDMNIEEIETSFLLKYKTNICCEAPYIADILKQVLTANNTENKGNKSPFVEDHCSVFMGGFGRKTTVNDIKDTLYMMGFNVVHCTELKWRKFGFSWVTLMSSKQADTLIRMSPIEIKGSNIDIRPYINKEKQKEKPSDENILKTVITLLLQSECKQNGLSIRDIQLILFKQFEHRISGTDLTEIVEVNPECLCIKMDSTGTDRIFIKN